MVSDYEVQRVCFKAWVHQEHKGSNPTIKLNLKLLQVYVPKTSYYVCFLFLRNDHSKNTVGQDQEFWTTDVVKQHLEEKYIKFNYAFFIWVISGARRN